MTKLRLPIGIQTFRKIREQNCYYVDKTPWIRALLHEGSLFFLSRPGLRWMDYVGYMRRRAYLADQGQ